MRELQKLVQRFLARQLGIAEMQSQFALLLQNDPDLAASAAAWLDAGEKDGLLSESLCASLKNVLVAYMAAANRGPNPRDSGVFDALEIGAPRAAAKVAGHAAGAEAVETFVRNDGNGSQATKMRSANAAEAGDSNDATITIGSIVDNRYEIIERIGSGGMGLVFKARDRQGEQVQDRNPYVALKIMGDEFKAHPDSLIALQREVRRAQSLAHPNVITMHEFYLDVPHPFMTMELLDGRSLDMLLGGEYRGGIAMERVWPIIEGIGKALQYGHDKGIVHSDIKPGNIFVCSDGTPKVLDFGISRPITVGNAPGTAKTLFDPGKRLGGLTPAYAAYEMWLQGEADPRDDVYALACVCYELLTGRHPFGGESARKAVDDGLVPERVDNLSRGQWAALAKALELRRADRTPTVSAFLKAIAPQSVIRARRRNLAVAGAVIAALIGAAGVWYYGLVVEDRALDDRGRLASYSGAPVQRPDLTEQQVTELEGLVRLGEIQLDQVTSRSTPDDVLYLLNTGPNNVSQIVSVILGVDPGFESGLDLRQRAFDLLLEKARSTEADDPVTAMSMTRAADSLIANQGEVLRLQRSICRKAPDACR